MTYSRGTLSVATSTWVPPRTTEQNNIFHKLVVLSFLVFFSLSNVLYIALSTPIQAGSPHRGHSQRSTLCQTPRRRAIDVPPTQWERPSSGDTVFVTYAQGLVTYYDHMPLQQKHHQQHQNPRITCIHDSFFQISKHVCGRPANRTVAASSKKEIVMLRLVSLVQYVCQQVPKCYCVMVDQLAAQLWLCTMIVTDLFLDHPFQC